MLDPRRKGTRLAAVGLQVVDHRARRACLVDRRVARTVGHDEDVPARHEPQGRRHGVGDAELLVVRRDEDGDLVWPYAGAGRPPSGPEPSRDPTQNAHSGPEEEVDPERQRQQHSGHAAALRAASWDQIPGSSEPNRQSSTPPRRYATARSSFAVMLAASSYQTSWVRPCSV